MGKFIWMQEWGLVVRVVKGCRHLLESYLLLSPHGHKLGATRCKLGAQLAGLW